MTADALVDVFAACVTAGVCALCARPLVDEAVWIADNVRCVDCARVHADPAAPRAHAVWRPSVDVDPAPAAFWVPDTGRRWLA